jgi:hypothetical protein
MGAVESDPQIGQRGSPEGRRVRSSDRTMGEARKVVESDPQIGQRAAVLSRAFAVCSWFVPRGEIGILEIMEIHVDEAFPDGIEKVVVRKIPGRNVEMLPGI